MSESRQSQVIESRCSGLPAAVEQLVEGLEEMQDSGPARARALLASSTVTAEDLAAWADFEHPAADSYGRKLVYDGGDYELMVMSWSDGDMSAIHDHGHAQWGAVKLFGPAEHAVFRIEGGVLTTASRAQCRRGTVLPVDHELIHQMGNRGQAPYLTLHLYGAPGRSGGVTGDARLYELDRGEIELTDGGVFFDLAESEVKERIPSPPADGPTTLRFKVELLRRLLIRDGSKERGVLGSARARRLTGELFDCATWSRLRNECGQMLAGDDRRRSRYLAICDEEMSAAAALMRVLVDDGLAEPVNSIERELAQLALPAAVACPCERMDRLAERLSGGMRFPEGRAS